MHANPTQLPAFPMPFPAPHLGMPMGWGYVPGSHQPVHIPFPMNLPGSIEPNGPYEMPMPLATPGQMQQHPSLVYPTMHHHIQGPHHAAAWPPGVPAHTGPHSPSLPPTSPTLSDISNSIRRQVEYYFSKDNLVKDTYLQGLMDAEGYVPLAEIAKFRRIQQLRAPQFVIVTAVRESSILDVLEDASKADHDAFMGMKIRARVPVSSS